MDDGGKVRRAERVDEPRQAGGVVEVAVAAHDHLDVAGVPAEPAQVLDATPRCEPRVEQQPVRGVTLAHLDEHREAVLGERCVEGLAALERRCLE